ncbi:peptidylprolyl isomerase [Bradyrhizobium sp.]
MKRLPTAELQRVYSVWTEAAKSDNVVVLREFVAPSKAIADKLRPKANVGNFSTLPREAGPGGRVNEIGEWSKDQLTDFFKEQFGNELFGLPISSVSSVRLSKGGGAFYLAIGRRKRTVPPFAEMRVQIEDRYNAYRSANRWTSWLPSSPTSPTHDDFMNWYSDIIAEKHFR